MNLTSSKFRWWALIDLSIGLAIVIIDNSVLNVAIPYILRDLHTSFDALQWVISGYALIIATILITVGRLGDLFGRKRIFLLGCVLFAIGSFIASLSKSAGMLFFGEAFIEAIGASMMLTSSLSLIVTEFEGRERALAFGVWGSVAGASAALGPLLGGYLTAYHSWRWSLRINVFVALLAILGSVFVAESRGEEEKNFDWLGTVFSGLGLFSLVFSLIEGRTYGWWQVAKVFNVGSWQWPLQNISVIPFTLLAAVVFLSLFVWRENKVEQSGEAPLMRPSMFKSRGFSFGLITLTIVSLGQFGSFFVLPIFLQNALGLDAFRTGMVFLWSSGAIFIFGPLSGVIASRVHNPRWVVSIGMFLNAIGILILRYSLSLHSSLFSLAPGLIIFGMGVGAASAQLTNIVLSNVRTEIAGEASAVNNTIRQVGTAVGIAILGMVLASSLSAGISNNISTDSGIPAPAKAAIVSSFQNFSPESGQPPQLNQNMPTEVQQAVKQDVNLALLSASKRALSVALIFLFAGAVFSLFIPRPKLPEWGKQAAPSAGH